MRYPLVVFDFDGTLADSLAAAAAVFNDLAPRFKLRPVADLETARRTPTRQLLRQMGISFWRLPKLIRAFQAAVAGHAADLKLHPGLAPVLGELAGRGHRLGIVSSNAENNIRACLRANGVEHHFAFVIGYPRLFGKARVLRRVLKAERAAPGKLVYVGDELRDIEAAKRVRVASAAVTWGFQAEELLVTGRPEHVVHTPAGLLGL